MSAEPPDAAGGLPRGAAPLPGTEIDEPHALVDLVNRVLDRGVVLHGDVTISVAGVDLVYLGLNALLTSISTARRALPTPPAAPLPALPPHPDASPDPEPGRPPPPPPGPAVGSLQMDDRPGPAPRGQPATEAGAPDPLGAALAARVAETVEALPRRVDVDPEGVQRDLGRLVLTVVELLRQVVEHQAVRRMEDDDLSEEQVERMGAALLRLEEKMREIKAVFGVADEDLNLDLGPLGKLL